MKYTYLYQTKTNENREGFIEARDRADAYTKLRKQGIRPYRIIGDDPVRWQPWAIGGTMAALVVALAVAVAVAFGGGDGRAPTSRQQLTGDRSVISTVEVGSNIVKRAFQTLYCYSLHIFNSKF